MTHIYYNSSVPIKYQQMELYSKYVCYLIIDKQPNNKILYLFRRKIKFITLKRRFK